MNKINYDLEMLKIIEKIGFARPKLTLHSCCAPCSSRCIEELYKIFDLTVIYYNPNIDTDEEYEHRMLEQRRFIEEFCTEYPVKFIACDHDADDFYKIAKGKETLPEGGTRCFDCYRLRLEKAAQNTDKGGYFATTLTLSPLKNAEIINKIGFELADKYGVNYLPTDFKKRNGYLRSLQLSAEFSLYRQNYCGCSFSKSENRL